MRQHANDTLEECPAILSWRPSARQAASVGRPAGPPAWERHLDLNGIEIMRQMRIGKNGARFLQ